MPKRWWKRNSSLILGGMLIGMLLSEIGLRMAGISYKLFYQYDADLGVVLRSGAEGWWKEEGKAYIRINSAGLRDREHARAKPPRTFRIAVLGDSYAEAMQVPMEETFWSVLERQLKGCPALARREPEVINFGVSGYGTAQELLMLSHRVWPYNPDVVILAFTTGNDVRNNSRVLEQDDLKPYSVFQNGELVPDLKFRDSFGFRLRQTELAQWAYRLWDSSRIIQLFAQGKWIVTTQNAQAHSYGHDSNPNITPWDGVAEAGLDSMVYREPRDPVWKEAWEVTEGLVVHMRDEVKEKGAEFLVVTASTGPQVHPDVAVRQSFAKRLGVAHLFYADLRIRDLGERRDFAVLNLAPLFQTYAEQHRVFLHGFENSVLGTGHWNKEGHRLAGELIASKLCSDVLGKAPSSP